MIFLRKILLLVIIFALLNTKLVEIRVQEKDISFVSQSSWQFGSQRLLVFKFLSGFIIVMEQKKSLYVFTVSFVPFISPYL